MALSTRDIQFAHNLVSGMTAVDAAMKAGFKESTARDRAATWIGNNRSQSQKPELFDYIEKLKADIYEGVKKDNIASVQEVMEFRTKTLRADISDFMEFDGYALRPKPFKEMSDDAKRLIQKIKFAKGSGTELELQSKDAAAKELMKFHGGYAPIKNEHTGKDGGPIKTEQTNHIDLTNLDDDKQKELLKFIFGNSAE